MPDSIRRFLKAYEVVEQMTVVLQVLLCSDSTAEDMFYRAPSWSKTCLFFFQQVLGLGL